MTKLYGGIEAGGTKFVCIVASGPENVVAETRFPTNRPEETIQQAIDFFTPYAQRGELTAIGIASFGPVDLDPDSATYGYITTTPKEYWQQVDLCGPIKKAFGLPVAFDTDVNAAAFGEHYWTLENKGLDPLVYVTIGTGIGGGVFANGSPLHGLAHPEVGHMLIPRDREKDAFAGVCPFHGDCLEGLASGPSMEKRWGQSAKTLAADHPAWDLEAEYIARALLNLVYIYSPQRIVLGGGVSESPGLHEAVRRKVREYNNGYIQSAMILDHLNEYIIPPTLGNRSGGLGAIAMAIELMDHKKFAS